MHSRRAPTKAWDLGAALQLCKACAYAAPPLRGRRRRRRAAPIASLPSACHRRHRSARARRMSCVCLCVCACSSGCCAPRVPACSAPTRVCVCVPALRSPRPRPIRRESPRRMQRLDPIPALPPSTAAVDARPPLPWLPGGPQSARRRARTARPVPSPHPTAASAREPRTARGCPPGLRALPLVIRRRAWRRGGGGGSREAAAAAAALAYGLLHTARRARAAARY